MSNHSKKLKIIIALLQMQKLYYNIRARVKTDIFNLLYVMMEYSATRIHTRAITDILKAT